NRNTRQERQRRFWLTAYATGWCRVNWNGPDRADNVHTANHMTEHGILPVKISAIFVKKVDEKLGATTVRGSRIRHGHVSCVVVEGTHYLVRYCCTLVLSPSG